MLKLVSHQIKNTLVIILFFTLFLCGLNYSVLADNGKPDLDIVNVEYFPEDPITEGDDDLDGDGLTNLKEYEAGTNPTKDIFIENAISRIKDNAWYLVGSIALFLLILILSIFDRRRKSK